MQRLWEKDIIENVYYDSHAVEDKFSYFPNISFFIKAKSKAKAKSILEQLTVTKQGIGNYTLYPVGDLWLKRNTDTIRKKGIKKSFVTVWTSTEKQATQAIIQRQSDSVLTLWKKGSIENVYFDMQLDKKDDKTDFVFFVNTDTQEQAENICQSLPFYEARIAIYKIHQVGVHWMGISNH